MTTQKSILIHRMNLHYVLTTFSLFESLLTLPKGRQLKSNILKQNINYV